MVFSDRDRLPGMPGSGGRRRSVTRMILATAALVGAATGSMFVFGSSLASSAVAPPTVPSGSRELHRRWSTLPQDLATPLSTPAFADLSSPVSIDNGECSFGPALDRAIRGMIVFEGSPPVGRAGRVELGGRHMTPALSSTRGEDRARPDFRSYEASIRLSPAAIWNGLRLTRLRLRTGWEWSARSLEFSDGPARVQAALRAMNIALPLPPGRREIPTDACSVSIGIETRPHGSALTCSGGCQEPATPRRN